MDKQNNSDISESTMEISKELVSQSLDKSESADTPKSFSLSKISYTNDNPTTSSHPILLISGTSSLTLPSFGPGEISKLSSPISLNMYNNQPQSLFLQALAKLNESDLSIAIYNHLKHSQQNESSTNNIERSLKLRQNGGELSPPDSLASAPPSYSFVLRQMAVRRRPRLRGTFIPSPSFVQHTPPPNYAAAFDVYVDNPLPTPARAYTFGFTPMPVICPECGYTGMTAITAKVTICTHLCAMTLCLFCCWICAPLPYILRSCKDVYHYCRNCRNYLGRYCPTNPENTSYE